MIRIIIRWAISALSIAAAVWLVPGIHVSGNGIIVVGAMALILGFVNAILRPILLLLTCPLILLTLGLFLMVVNGFTFWAAAGVAEWFNIGFTVDGFWPAFFGALVVSVVSTVLAALVPGKNERREKRN